MVSALKGDTVSTQESDAARIFLDAVENYEPDRWRAFVDDASRASPVLRARVFELLKAHGEPNMLLDGERAIAMLELSPLEKPGCQIGPYKLLEQIGEGGFGVVFQAEQECPVRRKVALKIIKPGMDSRQVIARFEAERQALALMDHPNIARVHDAGATENGRPYFVMELVQGVPITEYCDECNLGTRERLELFITVCQAVQHAHQKGVIHRDIKPTNVLVGRRGDQDGRPTPKIIDFGVAKAIDQRLTEHTLTTTFAQMVGTPLYMSPEQAELSPLGVDTRSDIYSLGVLLYELLTGTTPFDKDRLHASSYDEMRRIIREEEPPPPSARVSTIAANFATTIAEHRRTDARRLSQQVRGELDWIVMKCLEKDRNRRYETPSSLVRDIERYLRDEPVQACPPSTVYRLRKYVRRNRVPLTFAALLLAGLGYLAYSNAAIKRERDAKAMATARAKAVSDLLQEMLASPSRRGRIMGSQYTVRELLDDYSASLGNQLASQPDAEAATRGTIGRTYFYLGFPDRAEPHLNRQIELRRRVDGPQHENLADSLVDYGWNLFAQQRYDHAETRLHDALEIYRQRGIRGRQHINALVILQQVLASSGRHDEAERVIEQAWAAMQEYDELPQRFATSPVDDVIGPCAAFACYFATIGQPEQAAEFAHRAALAAQRVRNPIDSAQALTGLAIVRLRLGDQIGYREACAELVQLAPRIADDELRLDCIRVSCLGADAVEDPSLLVKLAAEFAANNSLRTPYIDLAVLGTAHYRAGQYEQAAQCLEEAVAQFPSDAPPSHGPDLVRQLLLAMTKWQLGEPDEARRMLREIQPRIDERFRSPWINWDGRAVLEIRRREAEALIEPDQAQEAVENESRTSAESKQ
jgi:non-specific serine/threonine protein kinase/serine/threonine-protein kinase